jgi:hypothetical protein
VLGHAAWQIDVNHRIGDGFEGFHFGHHRGCLEAQEVRQGKAEAASHADVEEIAAAHASAEVKVVALAVGVHFHGVLRGGFLEKRRIEAHNLRHASAIIAQSSHFSPADCLSGSKNHVRRPASPGGRFP